MLLKCGRKKIRIKWTSEKNKNELLGRKWNFQIYYIVTPRKREWIKSPLALQRHIWCHIIIKIEIKKCAGGKRVKHEEIWTLFFNVCPVWASYDPKIWVSWNTVKMLSLGVRGKVPRYAPPGSLLMCAL